MIAECLDHTSPAQIVVQIFGRHSMEPSHPSFQPRMVGVCVLDVVDAGQNPDSLADIHRSMGHTHFPGRQGDGALPSAVGTEHPAIFVMKFRKGRVRQGTKGALASLASVPGKSGRLSPWADPRMVAMGTSGGGSHQRSHLGYQVLLVPSLDRNLHIVSLNGCHGREISQTSLKCLFFYGNHPLNQVYT